MLLGQRICFFRILRGMTQKQLGKLMGYTDDTADIRISQYESGSRKPTGDTIELFAKALHISPYAMCIHGFHCLEEIMHTLFALEDMYGLSVENIDGKICVNIPDPSCDESFVVSMFLGNVERHSAGIPRGQNQQGRLRRMAISIPLRQKTCSC